MDNYRGNRWYKCDFHLHTPASQCFADKNVTPEEYIQKVKEEGLDCIAITDHNTADWIDKIKEAAQQENIVIFPGVELACGDSRIHLLVIFDVSCSKEKVEHFLIKVLDDEYNNNPSEQYSSKDINYIIQEAKKEGAIVIPAHIDDNAGLYNFDKTQQQRLIDNCEISGVQVVNEELILNKASDIDKDRLCEKLGRDISDIKKRINCVKLMKENNIGIFTFSDNPDEFNTNKHGLYGIGSQYTYIKMNEQPTLESVKQAMLFPDYRIRTCYENCDDINRLPEFWIKRIVIKNAEIIGKKPLEVEFSPQLSTIIGGRGSGKSTIVRFLTGIFGRDKLSHLDELYDEFNKFYSVRDNKSKKGVLKSSTEVEVEVFKNQNKYKIIAKKFKKNGDSDIQIMKIDETTGQEYLMKDILVNDWFNTDIYNQKQIYTLAKNQNSLRDTIDSLIKEMNDYKEKAKQYHLDYKSQYAKIKGIESNTNMKRKINVELRDIEEKINIYRKSGISEVLEKYENFNKQYFVLLKNNTILENKISCLENFINDFNKEEISLECILQKEYDEELNNLINNKKEKFKEILSVLNKTHNDLIEMKEQYIIDIKNSNWYRNFTVVKSEYSSTLDKFKNEGINISDINSLLEAQTKKQKELEKLIKLEDSLNAEKEKLDDIKEKYIDMRNQISQKRQNYINELLKEKNIRININRYRDKSNFISEFRRIIQRETGFEEDIENIVNKCLNGDIQKNIKLLIDDIENLRTVDNEKVTTMTFEFKGKLKSVIRGLDDEQIAMFKLFLPEDDVEVLYKPNNKSNYIKLENASAGQMTSAILTFVLADGVIPLILDQPEDDLDNHLISDLLVERLKECKSKRQIIVVTHNANIPVNGDAELTITMNSQSRKVELCKIGTIENEEIKQEICDVMEGGKDAFLMRANRYSLRNL